MKRYVPIVIGVVALCVVLLVANRLIAKNHTESSNDQQGAMMTSFTGKVVRNFEGENILEYGFDLPEGATTTIEKDGALVKVVSASSVPLFEMYFSFEGGRGYSEEDYITNVIVPHVSLIGQTATATLGGHEFSVVESTYSVWRIAKSENGQWLMVIESRKADAGVVDPIVESIITK